MESRDDEAEKTASSPTSSAQTSALVSKPSDDGHGASKPPPPGTDFKDENVHQVTTSSSENAPPYSVYTPSQKKMIIGLASLAVFFSPLSANIYYPALDVLSEDLKVSAGAINLTITTYMIFQGIAPSFIGTVADEKGRRPCYLVCFIVYIAACIGLALQHNYAALLVLRCIQSSGSSGTVALASAVVADIVTSAERGTYVGYANMGALIGPALGPVIGGLLCEFLSWRATFWFLAIFAGVTLVVIAVYLPETCRKVVGNGSLPPQCWNISLLSYLTMRKQRRGAGAAGIDLTLDTSLRTITRKAPNPLNTIWIILDKESGIILAYAGFLFAGYYMVLTAIPSQFTSTYHFNTLQLGLCYIPAGAGGMLSAYMGGKFIDWNFERHAKAAGMEVSKNKQQDLTGFPIERARLEVVLPQVLVSIALVIVFGWFLEKKVHLAGILIVFFFLTFTFMGAFQVLNTLVVDLNRDAPGTATAAMNLMRCWLGAAGVAAVVPIINAIGNGWTFMAIAGVWALMCPASFIVMKYGPGWRKAKREKEADKQRIAEAKKQAARDLEQGT